MQGAPRIEVNWRQIGQIFCFGWGALLIGNLFAWAAFNWASAPDWRSVPGTVLRADISSRGGNSRGSSRTYSPQLTYGYRVDGRDYTSNRFRDGSLSRNYMTESGAQAAIDRYTRQPQLIVYYDPADPQRAALDIGLFSEFALYAAGLGVIFVAAGFVMRSKLADDVQPVE